MPFPNQTARAFTKANIEAITPGQIGCYGLFRQGVWIYVGRGDIRARLLDHFNGGNPCITREKPTHWMDVVTSADEATERSLIIDLTPICNKKIG